MIDRDHGRDRELMLLVQRGDVDAFASLMARHRGAVYGMAVKMLRNIDDAEEAAQDAFVNLFRSRHRCDTTRLVEPWLMRIAGNACRDKRRRVRARALPGMPEQFDIVDPKSLRAPELAVQDQDVHDAVRGLPAGLSEVVRLRFLLGWSNQQVARATGHSLSNVKIRLRRGLRMLESRMSAR